MSAPLGPQPKEEGEAAGATEGEAMGATASGGSAPDTGPSFQRDVISVGNGAIFVATTLALRFAYDEQRDWPIIYLAVLGLIFLVAVMARADGIAQWVGDRVSWMSQGEDNAYHPGTFWQAFVARRDRREGAIVYVLAGLTVTALVALIVDTGLGIESPFIPLVTAPAVFGPFVAKNSTRVGLLVGTVAVVLAGITLAAPRSPCGIAGCPAPSLAEQRRCDAPRAPASPLQHCAENLIAERFRPHPLLYLSTSAIVLVAAGLIAARRLKTEQRLRAELAALRGDRPTDARG